MSAVLDAATAHLLPGGGKRELTADERQAVADCLDAAAAWDAGELPWWEAANVGAIAYNAGRGATPSTWYGRFVALRVTAPSDPRRAALMRLHDQLVRQSGITVTRFGCFEKSELAEAGAIVR